MKTDLIIYNVAQLLTCASNGKPKRGAEMQNVDIIENGALAIKDEVIIAVGKSGEIIKNFESENVIDAHKKVVCPAFVDPHTHIVYAGNRLNEFELKIKGADYLEILENGGGIISTVKQTRQASLKELIEQSRRRLDKMFSNGTLTAEIKTGYGLDTETELKMLEAIFELDKTHEIDLIPTFLPAHAVPPEYKEVQSSKFKVQSRSDDYVELICDEMLPLANSKFKIHNLKLPFFVDVFCERNAFSLEQSKRVLETAKSLGFKLKAHVDEFTNLGCAELAIELGATSIDHLDATSDEEIRLLAESNTIGIVTPTVNFNFGSAHFADARKMIDAGCAIAVSTDYNPGSAPCPSQPLAMAIACRYQKLLPSEAFNAATINAAFGLGLGKKIGSLEVGKQADVLILDTDDFRQAAYEFGGNFVESIVKKGRILNG
ncbi:MAG: imidazolonepropionase [Acidobacteria bacterium]|jgi:imidazolonepropionase|nr:imidazolonepropionase [Acidobacteriota bacterium]